MKILYYTIMVDMGSQYLMEMIHRQLPDVQVEQTTSIGRLYQKLCRPLNQVSAIVAFIREGKDFERLLSVQSFIGRIRLIVIVPDEVLYDEGSIQRLEPCFVCHSERNLGDVVSVLRRIVEKKGSQRVVVGSPNPSQGLL